MAEEVKGIDDLILKVRSYNSSADTEFLSRAYWFSSEAHQRQKRKEGTPYIEHPIAVASILADLKMDTVTIAAGILHDTIEDTDVTVDDISKRFGYDTAFLVKSLTKLSRMEFKSKEMAQAENFRKMLLSMAEDIRVILIKFADRLHNMRTLEFLPEAKRQRIATETLDIYAPISNRLGIGWLKTELEDLSFKYLMPQLYAELAVKVEKKREEHEGYIKEVAAIVAAYIKKEGISGTVTGRVKHYYGIYQKMLRQKVPFEQIYDVLGIRIITDTKANCYAILGLIHSLWAPVTGKFKDYIGVPKFNQYQSLHTTIIGPRGERVEFQIRTEDMDSVAEGGIASHWRYKEQGGVKERDERYITWLRDLVSAQTEMTDSRDFLDALKAEVVPHEVYVFTPNGDVKELPYGSTPVDFAYSIHTQVGHRCVGAKINGRMVPLGQKLQSGDTVEITTSPTHTPSRDWLKFVATQRAKTRVKQWLKTEERKQSLELGIKLFEAELRRHHLSPSLVKSEEMTGLAKGYNLQDKDDLLASIGFGMISARQAVNRLMPEHAEEPGKEPEKKPRGKVKEPGISIKGIDGVLYHTAKCCFPVPGDSLIGFITKGRGVAVHRRNCRSLGNLAVDNARVVDVEWASEGGSVSHAKLLVDTMDKPGMLANLSALISAMDINISHMEAATTADKKARIVFTLEVKDRAQLAAVMQKMAQMDGVLSIKR
ncbi:MAG: bifunctional (p)ppGpp synthetase/guanosine-3',5'-bis(diphosphate) 3'-pyrophosphohydrolase [Thermodesulfovibrionales bacterium]|nr:bifunctional (p)ppGpp synthetase/guanosine-3',5'-bis(diphosphate) 3'-pyrophosphohydrolase [Thermodesulfovibrionales bacterium]